MHARHLLCLYPHFDDPAVWPPLGLEYVATAAKQVTERVDLVDLRYVHDYREYLRDDTDAIALSFNWPKYYPYLCDLIHHVPKRGMLILGGRSATDYAERLLMDCPEIDVIVRGEGEAAIRDVLQAERLDRVDGISYRANGRVVHRPSRELLPVGDIPVPDRTLRVTPYAFLVDGVDSGVRFDTILTSRGCPYKCKFCSFDTNPLGQKRRWAARTPEDVVDEIAGMDADIIFWNDDNFMFDPDRVARICDLLIQRGVKKVYGGETRIDCAKRPDVLQKMYDAGFRMLGLGVEAVDDDSLKAMNRGYRVEDVVEAFEVLRQFDILTVAFYIAGWFGHSRRYMLDIADFSRARGIDFVCLSIMRYDPYSGLDEMLEAYPNYHRNESGQIYSDELSCRDIQGITRQIKADFYTPRQYLKILGRAWRGGLFHPKWNTRWYHHPWWTLQWSLFLPRVLLKKLNKAAGRSRKKKAGPFPLPATFYGVAKG